MRAKLYAIVSIATGIAALAYALHAGWLQIPDRWNPLAPLAIADEPNVLTRYKLSRLSGDDALCKSVLAGAEMRYQSVQDRDTDSGCGFHNAVRITATTARVNEPFTLTCASAVALALWEEHVLQPQAKAYFAHRVSRVRNFGSYSCRNIYGAEHGRRSEHATADAVDIGAFTLDDGRVIAIAKAWPRNGIEARFLRDVHDGACRFFNAVLGPNYNHAHYDHFHLDRGRFRVCR